MLPVLCPPVSSRPVSGWERGVLVGGQPAAACGGGFLAPEVPWSCDKDCVMTSMPEYRWPRMGQLPCWASLSWVFLFPVTWRSRGAPRACVFPTSLWAAEHRGIAVACMSSASWAWFLGPGGAVEYCKPRVVIPGWAVGCGCPWPGGWPLPAWACSLRLAVARKLLRAPVLPLSSAPLDAADGGGGLDWDSPCQHTQGSCPARTPSAEVPAPGHQRTSKGCRPVSSLPTSCGPVDGSGQASGQCSPGQLRCRIPPGGARPLLQASCPESPLHMCGRMSAGEWPVQPRSAPVPHPPWWCQAIAASLVS